MARQVTAEHRTPFRRRPIYRAIVVTVFVVLLVGGLLAGIRSGTYPLSPAQIVSTLLDRDGSVAARVLWDIRLPRVLLAALVGANLAVSGAILQGVMRNPLADPGIIGISAGAGFFGIVILVLYPQHQPFVPLAAFVGSMAAAGLIYVLAWRDGIQPMRVILAGVAVSALFGAGISAMLVFYSDRVQGALVFLAGSMSARSWPEVATILPYTMLGLLVAPALSRPLELLLLGDDVARAVGLRVEAARLGLTAVAALLAASAVSVVGLLGFVGLIVPHTVRLLTRCGQRYLILVSALAGAALVVISDTFARTVASPVDIPVGIVMAAVGAPFFLVLLRR